MPHLKDPYDSRLNKPFMTPIIEIVKQNERVKTFVVDYNPLLEPVRVMPGQFLMIWVPGSDEIPMSVSHIMPKNKIAFSVANVGDTTNKLHQMKLGDLIGIRGPYGNWYNPQAGIAIIIGGGIGMASILPLVQDLAERQLGKIAGGIDRIICIEGAKTESELLFRKDIEDMLNQQCELAICTDDGTNGFKGFTTEKLSEMLEIEIKKQHDANQKAPITVYACGPEKMLYKIFQLCEKRAINVQLSLERMMRCGFGICGLCAMEPTGLLVCRDGTIFNNEELRSMTSFGKETRDFSGKPRKI